MKRQFSFFSEKLAIGASKASPDLLIVIVVDIQLHSKSQGALTSLSSGPMFKKV